MARGNRHGTASKYKLGCRCPRCTKANTVYEKRRKRQSGNPPVPVIKDEYDTLTREEFMKHRYSTD